MKYMGSKNRLAKEIMPIMLKERGQRTWVEPFVGGGNMIDKVQGKRIGADINHYVIEALTAIRDCVCDLPKNNKEFTEADYKALRRSDEYKYKGYAGFAFSYGGKWLGGWSRTDKTGVKQRDYVNEAYKNALNQSPLLQGVRLLNSSYLDLSIPDNSLIYCDPPYEGTTRYKDDFNHDVFWQWCRDMSNKGHIVFVSEYNAPSDFECVWQKEIVSSLTQDTGSKKQLKSFSNIKVRLFNMGKFKPVAMPITFDQLQNEFKPMLKSLGLDVHGIFSGTTKYVVNIFNNRNNCIGICEYKIPSALKLTILAMYNPTEFLSYCDIPVVSETNSQIDHPKHYKGKDNPYEVIKVIEAWKLNFNLGNVLKYIGRLGDKDEEIQELEKALWYLQREINNRKNK